MKKYIFKISSLIMILALVITSCTDEKDFVDNKPIKNNKNLEQERPYPEYEVINIDSESLLNLLTEFNNAISGEIIMPSMHIDTALLLMETYFNYGVVAKQEIVDTTSYYTGSVFQFEVNLEEASIINGSELVEVYTLFLNEFLQQMEGKYLKFSDLFVKELDDDKVMFALEMPPFTEYDRIVWEPHKCKVLRSPDGPFEINENDEINLTTLFNQLGSSFSLFELSELASTYIYGFTYNIQTRNLNNVWIGGLGGQEPLIIYADQIPPLLKSAINRANNIFFGYDEYIKTELLIDAECNEFSENSLNASFYLAKVKAALYDFNPDWLIIDDLRFVGIY